MFYFVSIASVLLVLSLSANTAFADFPRLCIHNLLEQTAENMENLQRILSRGEDGRMQSNQAVMSLTERIATLSDSMRTSQQLLLRIAEAQSALTPALQRLAAWYRRAHLGQVVAITGSNGKTIVKDALHAQLVGTFALASPQPRAAYIDSNMSSISFSSSLSKTVIFSAGFSRTGLPNFTMG